MGVTEVHPFEMLGRWAATTSWQERAAFLAVWAVLLVMQDIERMTRPRRMRW